MTELSPWIELLTGASATALAVIAWRISTVINSLLDLLDPHHPEEWPTLREIRAAHDHKRDADEIIQDIRQAKLLELDSFQEYGDQELGSEEAVRELATVLMAQHKMLNAVTEYLELNHYGRK